MTEKNVVIVGPQGTIFFNYSESNSGFVDVSTCDLFVNGKLVRSGEQQPHNFTLQMKEFSTAILEKQETTVKKSDILKPLAFIDAAKKSAEIQQPVDINSTF